MRDNLLLLLLAALFLALGWCLTMLLFGTFLYFDNVPINGALFVKYGAAALVLAVATFKVGSIAELG